MVKKHQYKMGPWYEETGPSAVQVRSQLLKKIRSGKENTIIYREEAIDAILLKHIPDTMNNFGSWRGFATFGLDKPITVKINKDIEHRKVALEIIQSWLREKVIHYLYKPNGPRMRAVSTLTLVGKQSSKIEGNKPVG